MIPQPAQQAPAQMRRSGNDGVRYRIQADHEERELAEMWGDTYMETIIDSIKNQPRSLQKRIGPSEMGVECERQILHKLNGDKEPPRRDIPWKPTIGTAVHGYLEDVFNKVSREDDEQPGRWLVENRVAVGIVGGVGITGSTDIFDTWCGVVGDHKCVGKAMLAKYRAHGPSAQYRIQAHLYGAGWKRKGHHVRMVAICFLPREGELDDTFIWTEPFREEVALAAVARVDRLAKLLEIVGIDAALKIYGECTDRWCSWCSATVTRAPRGRAAATTADLFATQ